MTCQKQKAYTPSLAHMNTASGFTKTFHRGQKRSLSCHIDLTYFSFLSNSTSPWFLTHLIISSPLGTSFCFHNTSLSYTAHQWPLLRFISDSSHFYVSSAAILPSPTNIYLLYYVSSLLVRSSTHSFLQPIHSPHSNQSDLLKMKIIRILGLTYTHYYI